MGAFSSERLDRARHESQLPGVNSGGRCITDGEDWFLVLEVGDGADVGVGAGVPDLCGRLDRGLSRCLHTVSPSDSGSAVLAPGRLS